MKSFKTRSIDNLEAMVKLSKEHKFAMTTHTLIFLLIFCIGGKFSYSQKQSINNGPYAGINTHEPKTTLDVNGKLTIRDTGNIENEGHIKPLYVDTQTGLVGTIAPSIPTSPISVFTAHNGNILPFNEINADKFNIPKNRLFIPFSKDDIAINNLGLVIDGNNIVIQEDGSYQINAHLNIMITSSSDGRKNNYETTNTDEIIDENLKNNKSIVETITEISNSRQIFLYAELKKNDKTIAGIRPILYISLNNQSNIITLPTVIRKFEKGDRLSLAFSRTEAVIGFSEEANATKGAGDDVNKIGLTDNFETAPYYLTIMKL